MRDPCLIVSVAIVFPGRASTAIESVWSFADVRDVLRVRLNAMRGQCFLLGQPEGVAARLQPRDVRWTWNVQVQLEVPASLAHRQDLVLICPLGSSAATAHQDPVCFVQQRPVLAELTGVHRIDHHNCR